MIEPKVKHEGFCKKCNAHWIYGFSFVAMVAQCPKCGDPIPIEAIDDAKPQAAFPPAQGLGQELPCASCHP